MIHLIQQPMAQCIQITKRWKRKDSCNLWKKEKQLLGPLLQFFLFLLGCGILWTWNLKSNHRQYLRINLGRSIEFYKWNTKSITRTYNVHIMFDMHMTHKLNFQNRTLFICIIFSDPIIGRFTKMTTSNNSNFSPFFRKI